MTIRKCTLSDIPAILKLYEAARALQTERKVVVWLDFDASFLANEIQEDRQWKLMIDGEIACNWAITWSDPEIWEGKDLNDAIYIHRIATNPDFRGKSLVKHIVEWAKSYAATHQKQYVRLDTLGHNARLIRHYTEAGFRYLGMVQLSQTENLPPHYQKEPDCCLFETSISE
jgi:ribosomal protein S18 acetylase RimI-like enzyme